MSDLRLHLRRLRKEQGLTLRAISQRAGISIAYLSEIETGNADNVGVPLLLRLADALGVSAADLLGKAPKRYWIPCPHCDGYGVVTASIEEMHAERGSA